MSEDEDSIVLQQRDKTSVFFNASGGVTIMQARHFDDDAIIAFDICDIPKVIRALRAIKRSHDNGSRS